MTTPAPRRPWYRLHWITWLFAVVVGWAFVQCQLEQQSGWTLSSADYTSLSPYGWPAVQLDVTESGSMYQVAGYPRPTFEYEWDAKGVCTDLLVAVLFLASTVALIESWFRKRPRWQFSLRSVFIMTTTVAVLFALITHQRTVAEGLRSIGLRPFFQLYIGGYSVRLPHSPTVYIPILFGVGCMVYVGIALAGRLLSKAFSRIVGGRKGVHHGSAPPSVR